MQIHHYTIHADTGGGSGTRQAAYNDRLETDLTLAGILRRYLRGDRWWQTEDGGLLYIDDSVDLTPDEQAAILEAVEEA